MSPSTTPARSPSLPSAGPTALAEAARARRLLLGLYLLLGITVSSWLARLPSVRSALDLSEGRLGLVLLVGAVGSLLTVLVAGAVVTRFGSRRTLLAAAVVFSVAALLLGLGPALGSVVVLTVGVVAMTASFALGNVPMNVETVVIERALGRTVVPQFHAAFSIGALLGSLIGAACAWAEVPVLAQMAVTSLVSLVWRFLAVPGAVLPLPPADLDAPPVARRGLRSGLGAWRERRTLLVGVIVLTAALSEGSANNWLAIAVVDGFGQTAAVAAVVFGVFVGAMTLARLLGTWAIDAFGRVAVLAASGVTALGGLLLFGLAPSLPLAVLGVFGWGLGAGLVVPIGFAAVSHDRLAAAGRVAVVSAFASIASLAAPPLLGGVAEAIGARHALMLVAVGLVASIVLAGTVREPAADGVRPGGPHGPAVPGPRVPSRGLPSTAAASAGTLAPSGATAVHGGARAVDHDRVRPVAGVPAREEVPC